jgi:hypothetical protein
MLVSGQLHVPGKVPPLDRRLGRPQSQCGCCGEEKNLFLLVVGGCYGAIL